MRLEGLGLISGRWRSYLAFITSILPQIQYKQCPETRNGRSFPVEAFAVRRVLSEMNAFSVLR